MDERKEYRVTLADGTEYNAVSDGAGNLIITGTVDREDFSPDNLSQVILETDGQSQEIFENQVLRSFYERDDQSHLIRISDMTEIERLEADYTAKLDYLAMMTDVDLEEA